MTTRNFPNLRLLLTSHKGHYFGAYATADKNAKKGYDLFISTKDGVKDWCECMGHVHGKICYHLIESKKRFSQRGNENE